tara:strand:- start:1195 stop:1611 length:417 start_codon:yes stop_codon:yes gene_type:complete
MKKYLSKIIANDSEGLQMISACCAGAELKVSDIKYLKKNKVLLLSLIRSKIETENEDKKVNSICKFEYVDTVKSKNINQERPDQKLQLLALDYLKNKGNFEINLIFTNIENQNKNAYITLSSEIIDISLEDQQKLIND